MLAATLLTLGVVFLAELGDRSQLITMTFAMLLMAGDPSQTWSFQSREMTDRDDGLTNGPRVRWMCHRMAKALATT